MIRVFERDELDPFWLTVLEEKLDRHLDRHLDPSRSIIRIKDLLQRRSWQQINEPAGKLHSQRISEPQERSVRDFFQLGFQCFIDRRVPMPMNICPDRRVPVQIASALAIL